MTTGQIINTQWLFRQPAVVVSETPKQYIVSYAGKRTARFWKKNGYQLGYSRIFRIGCEPDRLIITD